MQEIIEDLHDLGFKVNDAKVYVALLQMGRANPTKISKKTNIVRARVYDSLKRLEKQGYIEREAVKNAPLYAAVKPDVVFSYIKNDLATKLGLSEQLESSIKDSIKVAPDKGTWAIKGVPKIKSKIKQIISKMSNTFCALITPDFTKDSDNWIFDLLLTKAQDSINMSIGMKINENNVSDVKKLLEKGVKIHHWHFTEEMPLGIYTSDSKNTLITVIGSWKKYYKHNIGFLIQGPSSQHKGFEFLTQWFLSSCKKAEERISELEGD